MKGGNLFIILIIIITAGLFSCKSDVDSGEVSDHMTSEESLTFEQLQDQYVTSTSIKLPNEENAKDFLLKYDPSFIIKYGGKLANPNDSISNSRRILLAAGIQDKKNILISKMLLFANNLIDGSKQTYVKDGNAPTQTKIAYGLGSKDYLHRLVPSDDECGVAVFALDCSGFVHHILKAAGINIVQGQSKDQTAGEIQRAIRNIPGYEKIEVKDEGTIPYQEIESGDIMYFKKRGVVKHIGVALQTYPGKVMLYQSNGVGVHSTYKADGSVEKKGCEYNTSASRGPRMVELKEPMSWRGAYDSYGIIRIETDISGKWELDVRCEGTTTDVFKMNLDFPFKEDGEFRINQSGVDYNGNNVDGTFNFKYIKEANVLDGTFVLSFPSIHQSRTDKFSIKLLKDDSGYFSMTKVTAPAGGCTMQSRLIHKE